MFKALGLNRRQSVRLGEDTAAPNHNEPNAKMSENTATASFTSKQDNKEKYIETQNGFFAWLLELYIG